VEAAMSADRKAARRAALKRLKPWVLAFLLHLALVLLSLFIVLRIGALAPHGEELHEIKLAPGGGGGGGGNDAPLGDGHDKGRGKLTFHEDPLARRTDIHAEPIPGRTRHDLSLIEMGAAVRNPEFKLAPMTTADGQAPSGQIFYKQGDGGFGEGHGGRGGGAGDGTGPGSGSGRGPGIGPGDMGPTTYTFVIDASGSLIEGMPFVIDQLKEFIRDLAPDEEFAIFFFQEDKALQVVEGALKQVQEHQGFLPATDFNKARAIKALDEVRPQGTSSPREALRIAFSPRYPPMIVYLLSDNITSSGPYELRRETLLREFALGNSATGKLVPMPDGKGFYKIPPAKIHAVQYLAPDPLLKQGFAKSTLQEIVEQNNERYLKYFQTNYPGPPGTPGTPGMAPPPVGTYRYIAPADLFGKE
jgi:hypothetical protein